MSCKSGILLKFNPNTVFIDISSLICSIVTLLILSKSIFSEKYTPNAIEYFSKYGLHNFIFAYLIVEYSLLKIVCLAIP